MKVVQERNGMQWVRSSVICDRCGAAEPCERSEQDHQTSFATVTVDRGPHGALCRGDFCSACMAAFEHAPGGCQPYLRQVGQFSRDRKYRYYRFKVLDAATGNPLTISSILDEDELM